MKNVIRTVLLAGMSLLITTQLRAQCFNFETDPVIHSWPNPDGSDTYWFNIGHPVTVSEGSCISIGFMVSDGSVGSVGHTTVLGPRSSQDNAWPTLQLNLYFGESAAPGHYKLSMAQGQWSGVRYEAAFGTTYHAVFIRSGGAANFMLFDDQENVVHQDSYPYDWPSFDAFQLCYDYYTGDQGFCAWDGVGKVDFLADRGPDLARYLRGSVDYVCVEDGSWCRATPVEWTSFGRLKALYR